MIARLTMLLLTLLLALGLLGSVSGCVALFVGAGAAGGVGIAHDRRSTGAMVNDQTIEWRADTEMNKNLELANPEQTHINVTSYNNVVLLTGEVPTPALRQRVVEIIRYIPEVKLVYNELLVALPSSPEDRALDAALTTRVKVALLQISISDFDPTRVKVVTERGTVYLLGLLRPAEADATVAVVRQVDGVKQVVKLFENYS
jgi:osmotically-inducible protein OsmY